MAERVTAYSPSGRPVPMSRRTYERVWKRRGYRLSQPKKTSVSASAGTVEPGDEPESKE